MHEISCLRCFSSFVLTCFILSHMGALRERSRRVTRNNIHVQQHDVSTRRPSGTKN